MLHAWQGGPAPHLPRASTPAVAEVLPRRQRQHCTALQAAHARLQLLPVHGLHRPAHTTAPAAVHDVRPRPRVSQHRSTASVVLVVLREHWLSGLTLWVCALYCTESLSAGRAFSPLNFIHSNQWRVLIPAKRVHCVHCPAMIVSWLCEEDACRWRCRPPVLTASYWLIVCVALICSMNSSDMRFAAL